MRNGSILGAASALLVGVTLCLVSSTPIDTELRAQTTSALSGAKATVPLEVSLEEYIQARYKSDLEAIQRFRPAFSFWQHIFTIPDGSIIFGSAETGQLLATFPTRGNWIRDGVWEDSALVRTLDGLRLQSRLNRRRSQVEEILEPLVGPVVHNPTRGRFLSPHAEEPEG